MGPEDEKLISDINNLHMIFKGDWVGTVLVLLRGGGKQYRLLRDAKENWSIDDPWTGRRRSLHNGELVRTLARMTSDGLLKRTAVPGDWRPSVYYELSAEAHELFAALASLLRWAEDNGDFFERAQQARAEPTADATVSQLPTRRSPAGGPTRPGQHVIPNWAAQTFRRA